MTTAAELLKAGPGAVEQVVPEGEYVLRVESVNVVKNGLALRPECRVVGGPDDGARVCPGLYDFGGEKYSFAFRNVIAWGVPEEEVAAAPDVATLAEKLVGRTGKVWLSTYETRRGESVNTHKPGGVTPVQV